MRECAFAIPGDLGLPTGGYAYDRRIMDGLLTLGWTVRHVRLGDDFPQPSARSLDGALAALQALPPDSPVMVDGLAFGVLPAAELAAMDRSFVALVHHPLALETGISSDLSRDLIVKEKEALTAAAHVIVTSSSTAYSLQADFGVEADRITVVLPGVEHAPRAHGSSQGSATRLLAVGSLIPRKGYDVLIAALASLRELDWTCHIIGADDRDLAIARKVRDLIHQHGLEDRVTIRGGLGDDEVAAAYLETDIFVLASHYEGYGMVFTEALARGLPIVACAGGATAQTVPADAGILIKPGDAQGFSLALRLLLVDPKERQRRADAAWSHASTLPTWEDAASRVSTVLEGLL